MGSTAYTAKRTISPAWRIRWGTMPRSGLRWVNLKVRLPPTVSLLLLADLCERSGDTAKALRTLRGLAAMQRERFPEDSARQVRLLQVAFDVEQSRATEIRSRWKSSTRDRGFPGKRGSGCSGLLNDSPPSRRGARRVSGSDCTSRGGLPGRWGATFCAKAFPARDRPSRSTCAGHRPREAREATLPAAPPKRRKELTHGRGRTAFVAFYDELAGRYNL